MLMGVRSSSLASVVASAPVEGTKKTVEASVSTRAPMQDGASTARSRTGWRRPRLLHELPR